MGGSSIRRAAAVALLATSAWAADVRVLATTGVRIDGFGLAGIEQPVGLRADDVIFRGVRTSVELAGRTFASGDPLPAPLTGTIEEIQQGASASHFGAFVTAANGPDVAWAIFFVEGTGVTPLVTIGGAEGRSLGALTMNARGDVAYNVVGPKGGTLFVRTRATGESTAIMEEGDTSSTLRGFTMDDAGAVAWMDSRGRVFHWDKAHGIRTAGLNRRGRALVGPRRAVALHPTYGLAFATRDALMKWDPGSDAQPYPVLQRRANVGGTVIRRFYGDVGFLDDGSISVGVRPGKYVCTGAPPVACTSRGKAGSGEAVPPRRQAGVFRRSSGSTEAVVRPGDVLRGDGQLEDVVGDAVSATTVAFVATLSDQRKLLGRSRDGLLETLAVDGQRVRGLTLELGTTVHDAGGAFVAVDASLLDGDGKEPGRQLGIALIGKGRVRALSAPRGKRFRFAVGEDAAVVGNRVVVFATDPTAFLAGTRRTKPVLLERDRLELDLGRGADTLAVSGSHVLFVGRTAEGEGLYELDGRKPRRVTTLPGAPTLLAASRGDVAFTVTLSPDGGLTLQSQLWIVDRRGARALVRAGDPTPLGSITSIDAVGLTSDDVVFVATLAGNGARHALLAVSR
jgi:hypothetical protein